MPTPEPPTADQVEAAKSTVAIYQRRDPTLFYRANLFQQRLYRAVREPKIETLTVVLALKPNRVGGSFGIVNILSAIFFGTENPMFQGSPFGDKWPFLKAARLFSTPENLADVGALQIAIKALFPVGKYEQNRGVGKAYNSAMTTKTGWNMDSFSYGQDALAAAGANKGLIVMSEPPPRPLFTEGITRLSGNGLIVIECVQLDLAPWLEDLAEDAGGRVVDGVKYGALKLDGKSVGEVRVVRGDVEDACREHSQGHMAHTAIEAMVAAWPVEEREARRTGKPMKLSGRILPLWGDENEIEVVPEWHRSQWDAGNVRIVKSLDPHDRKPWAMAWFAVYPNDDVIAFQEWPPFNFSECKSSPVSDVEDYRNLILEMETVIGREVHTRVIDKLFGNSPGKGNALTLKKMLARPCRACLRHIGRTEYEDLDERSLAYLEAERGCKHRLSYVDGVAYDGSVNAGHILMRTAIGNPAKGIRPKLYAMREYCPNLCFGMRRYAWKENAREDRGLSEKPQLVNKDFPDVVANVYKKALDRWPRDAAAPPPAPDPKTWKPTDKPKPMTGTATPRDARPRFK